MARLKFYLLKIAIFLVLVNEILSSSIEWPEECSNHDICYTKVLLSREIRENMKKIISNIKLKNEAKNKIFRPKSSGGDDPDLHDDGMKCPSISWTDQPFLLREQEKVYPAFQTEIFEQYLHHVECDKEALSSKASGDRQCYSDELAVEKSTCVQKHAQVPIYVYDETSNGIIAKNATIGTCCKCEF